MHPSIGIKVIQTLRLGSAVASEQVRQAVANVTLEGLRPSSHSLSLAHAVASGAMTADDAVAQLRAVYARHA